MLLIDVIKDGATDFRRRQLVRDAREWLLGPHAHDRGPIGNSKVVPRP